MKRKILMLFFACIVVMGLIFSACTDGDQTEKSKPAIDLTDLDTSVNPAEDFDNYANGGWKAKHPIPAEKSRFGTFDQLADLGESQVKSLIEKTADANNEPGSVGYKIGTMYRLGMDTAKIEEQGLKPLDGWFAEIEVAKTKAEIEQLIAKFHTYGMYPLFSIYAAPDSKNSDWVIAKLYQSGLSMERDYYLNDDERSKTLRVKYVEHLGKMFALMGDDVDVAAKNAGTVMTLETRLAKASNSRLENRDPNKTYNKINLSNLIEMAPGFDWGTYFKTIGVESTDEMNVGQPNFFAEAGKMMQEVSVDDWKTYLRWNLIDRVASYLSSDFEAQNFDYFGKTMSGTEEMRPRWKRVLGVTSSSLSEAVGELYVAEFFPPEAKERMLTLVKNLQASLGKRIENLDWMSDDTKAKGLEKLAAMKVKIGYPDKWKDYSSLEIKEDAYVLNVLRARHFGFVYEMNKVNKAVDKAEWFMPPQTVNAYYSPQMNEIVFPAAILQPPFFFMDSDDAVNYGAIGVVIGHEMTHGFDDQGCKYDKNGNLNNWWSDEDAERFNERTEVLVNQFNNFEVLDTIKADGKLSLGENIADLGGLNIAYQAFQMAGKKSEPIEGFSSKQRFFLAYAHVWGQNIRDKEILRRTKEDVHSLGRFRVIGPLRNMPEFHEAFNVKAGDYMYLAEIDRSIIW